MDGSTSPSPLASPVASKESTPPTPPDNENNSTNNDNSNTSNDSSTTTGTTATTATTTNGSGSSTSGAKKVKKIKPISRAPIATGISTNIPVTGEKPKPIQEGDASLEDNVLYSIFVILYEKDPTEEGMTVKQLCEMLETLHPELVNMSSKTSNLVSAKLNAYIKKLEKTDSSLKYAISREWADASPKRMVYKYRGLLAPGWEKVMEELKKTEHYESIHTTNDSMKKVETSVKNLDLSDNDEDIGPTTKKSTKKQNQKQQQQQQQQQNNQKVSQSASVSPKQEQQHIKEPVEQTLQLQIQQGPQQPTKRRATMFDFGRRPSFLSLEEFPEPPPPYLINKSKITPTIEDDEVFIDIEEDDDEDNEEDHPVIVKKRRTISSISKFNWGNLGATELDTAAITAMRRESVSMFEVGVCFPSPSDTSLQDLDKMF